MRIVLILPLVLACSVDDLGPATHCLRSAPAEGTVVIRPLQCSEELVPDGEGQLGDWLVATPHYRAIFRHPLASLTVSGWGGGTLIDWAPWGQPDGLHELIPLTDGGWMNVEKMWAEDNHLNMSGHSQPWPDESSAGAGDPQTIQWVFSAENSTLEVLGNDDLWIHPAGDVQLFDMRLIGQQTTLTVQAVAREDRGGAILFTGAHQLHIRDNEHPLPDQESGHQTVSGRAPQASAVEFLIGEAVAARLNLRTEHFETTVSTAVTSVRARGAHGAVSPALSPDSDLTLALRPLTKVNATVDWGDAKPRPLTVSWNDEWLGEQWTLVKPDGDNLFLPTSVGQLFLSAGPHVQPSQQALHVPTAADTGLLLHPIPISGLTDHKWVALHGLSDRSKRWRGSDGRAFREALSNGLDWTVLTPRLDVASGVAWETDSPYIQWRHGALSPHPEGFSLLSWPWKEKAKRAGGGVPNVATLGVTDALATLLGAPDSHRLIAATPGWFALTPEVAANALMPTFIWVDEAFSKSDPIDSLQPWFDRLDLGNVIPPVGSQNWVQVTDENVWSGVDIEASLLRGRAVASTGPLLTLSVQDKHPGQVVVLQRQNALPPMVQVLVNWQGEPADVLWLVGEGGLIKGRIDGPIVNGEWSVAIADPGRWLLALATSEMGGPWAMTGPIWFDSARE